MDFNTLAFSPLCRMSDVKRYSSVYQQVEENLAEHVAEVCAMSFLICKKLKKLGETIDEGLLLSKCLVHDVDEVITGDVPRNTKYFNNETHVQLDRVANEAVVLISKQTEEDLFTLWSSAKEGKEGSILKIVDMLVVAKKVITEISLRKNLSFLKVVIELKSHLEKMLRDFGKYKDFYNDESYEFLYNLVKGADEEIGFIKKSYIHIIDRYSLRENVIKGE